MLKEEADSMKGVLPPEIESILGDYKDVMPMEFPKKLPPRREVDHAIELVLGM